MKEYFNIKNTVAFTVMVLAFSVALVVVNIGWYCLFQPTIEAPYRLEVVKAQEAYQQEKESHRMETEELESLVTALQAKLDAAQLSVKALYQRSADLAALWDEAQRKLDSASVLAAADSTAEARLEAAKALLDVLTMEIQAVEESKAAFESSSEWGWSTDEEYLAALSSYNSLKDDIRWVEIQRNIAMAQLIVRKNSGK